MAPRDGGRGGVAPVARGDGTLEAGAAADIVRYVLPGATRPREAAEPIRSPASRRSSWQVTRAPCRAEAIPSPPRPSAAFRGVPVCCSAPERAPRRGRTPPVIHYPCAARRAPLTMIEFQPPPPDRRSARRRREMLASAKTPALTGHERPDGDCVGSQAALARMLTARGVNCIVLNPDSPERRYGDVVSSARFLVDDGGIKPPSTTSSCSMEGICRERARASRSACGRLPRARSWSTTIFTTETSGGTRPSWTRASATGVLVRRIGAHLGAPVDERTAVALFTTLVTDTGWFKYSNTDAGDAAPRRSWAERGVQPAGCLRGPLPASGSLARVDAQRSARADLPLRGRCARRDRSPLQPDGTPLDVDGDGVLDVLRAVESVEVALLLRAIEPALCKLSARAPRTLRRPATRGRLRRRRTREGAAGATSSKAPSPPPCRRSSRPPWHR